MEGRGLQKVTIFKSQIELLSRWLFDRIRNLNSHIPNFNRSGEFDSKNWVFPVSTVLQIWVSQECTCMETLKSSGISKQKGLHTTKLSYAEAACSMAYVQKEFLSVDLCWSQRLCVHLWAQWYTPTNSLAAAVKDRTALSARWFQVRREQLTKQVCMHGLLNMSKGCLQHDSYNMDDTGFYSFCFQCSFASRWWR